MAAKVQKKREKCKKKIYFSYSFPSDSTFGRAKGTKKYESVTQIRQKKERRNICYTFLFIIGSELLIHNLELLFSLNHDLLTVLDVQTLLGHIHLLAVQVVNALGVLLVIHSVDTINNRHLIPNTEVVEVVVNS